MAKVNIPTTEEIEAKKDAFLNKGKEVIQAEKDGKASPKKLFLNSISKEIKSLIDDGISYVGIRRVIKEVYSVDVSVQLIRKFAYDVLKIEPRKKSAPLSTKGVKDKVFLADTKDPKKATEYADENELV